MPPGGDGRGGWGGAWGIGGGVEEEMDETMCLASEKMLMEF